MSCGERRPRARRGLALLPLALAASLWWALATPPAPGKVLGLYSADRLLVLLALSYALGWGSYLVLSRAPKRLEAARLALTTSALLVPFGLLELPAALGMVDYRLGIPMLELSLSGRDPSTTAANRVDQEPGHLHRRGRRVVGQTVGDLVPALGIPTDRRYDFDVRYDSRGFRNEHDLEQAPVVVIGDSFVEAGLVPHGALLSTHLSRLLRVDVANLGQGHSGPQQELLVLRHYGVMLGPRIVLWLFFEGNDLIDARRHERFLANVELHDFKERSFTKNALLALARLTGPAPEVDAREAHLRSCRLAEDRADGDETLYFGYPGAPLTTEDVLSLEIVQRYVLEAQRVASEHGAELLLVYVPTKLRVYRDLCVFPVDGLGNEWRLNDLPSRLEGWSSAHGVPYVDLTPALQAAASDDGLVYYPDDTHWNARGNAVGAEAIAGFLREHGRLDLLGVATDRSASGFPFARRPGSGR